MGLQRACPTPTGVDDVEKKSRMWLYFTRLNAEIGQCNKCNMLIAARTGNLTNSMKHLTVAQNKYKWSSLRLDKNRARAIILLAAYKSSFYRASFNMFPT